MPGFIDKTGEPRSNKAIQEAIQGLRKGIMKELHPSLIFYPTAIDAMEELLTFRKILKELHEKHEKEVNHGR